MRAQRIDHVHIEVRDRVAAAAWYGRVLGLERHAALAGWADDPMGPMILSAGDGEPALSLFQRGCATATRDATIAFRLKGSDFMDFIAALPELRLTHDSGRLLRADDIQDHGLSWSFYFNDPDGNRIEVTCYDYDMVAAG